MPAKFNKTRKTHYSDKKKRHAVKTQLTVNQDGLIIHKTAHAVGSARGAWRSKNLQEEETLTWKNLRTSPRRIPAHFFIYGAGGGIWTHERLRDRVLSPTPLTWLGDPCINFGSVTIRLASFNIYLPQKFRVPAVFCRFEYEELIPIDQLSYKDIIRLNWQMLKSSKS